MVKTDQHMAKVKEQLMFEQKQIELAEERWGREGGRCPGDSEGRPAAPDSAPRLPVRTASRGRVWGGQNL